MKSFRRAADALFLPTCGVEHATRTVKREGLQATVFVPQAEGRSPEVLAAMATLASRGYVITDSSGTLCGHLLPTEDAVSRERAV